MFANAAEGGLQDRIAGAGRQDEDSLLSVAFRRILDESTQEIVISVGKASCSVLLQMRDVNLFLLKTYVKGYHLTQPNLFPPSLSMIPIQAVGALCVLKVKEQKESLKFF